jgi:hypothetical protein
MAPPPRPRRRARRAGRSNEAPELSPLEACMQMSLFGATFLRIVDGAPVPLDDERFRAAAKGPWVAQVSGSTSMRASAYAPAIAKVSSDSLVTVHARRSAWNASRPCPMAASRTCFASRAAMARRTS